MADTLKQRDTKLIFELLDLKGYGGLRVAEFFSSLRETGKLRSINKCVQVFKIYEEPPYF